MKQESLDHAIRSLEIIETDLHRISIVCNDAQAGLIGDCAEHRIQMLNKLRHIKTTMNTPMKREESTPWQKAMDAKYEENKTLGQALYEMNDDYTKHAQTSDTNALAAYRRRVRFIGFCLCAIASGIILAIATIVFMLIGGSL